MKVFNYEAIKNKMGATRTVADFGSYLGQKPHMLGKVASMYDQLTATYLTEGLMNIHLNEKKSASSFQPVDAMVVEWGIDVGFIKRIPLAAQVVGTGANGAEATFVFRERYYEKNDTFVIDRTRDVLFVIATPTQVANGWSYQCVLVDPERNKSLDTANLVAGVTTRFRSNYHSELSRRGYAKYQSNVEKHRNYLSLHRVDVEVSGQFSMQEDLFVEIAEGKKGTQYFKLNKAEKDAFDTFMFARNQNLLFGKSNFDSNGRCTIQDPETGLDIPMGDGIIPQIERYCDKFVYSKLTYNFFQEILSTLRSKSSKLQGNQYVFIVNAKLWDEIQISLLEYLQRSNNLNTILFSQKAGGMVEVGATFDTYSIGGNTISFKVDLALTQEYEDRPYGIMLDLSPDTASGKAAIMLATLKGADMIKGTLKGMGGVDGKSSGDVATPIHGARHILMGYAGVMVMNPYRSAIIEKAIS